jgi:hypothetical protein
MSSRGWCLALGCLLPLLVLSAACSPSPSKEPTDDWRGICIDVDGDGYGFQCLPGADCDDSDGQIHEGCGRCNADKPGEGCACAEGSAPVQCTLPYELTRAGSLLCKEGNRYCRDGKWTGCEGVGSFTAPPRKSLLSGKLQGLTGDASVSDAGTSGCSSPCNPDCYRGDDEFSGLDAGPDGGGSSGVVSGPSGGITLSSTPARESTTKDAGPVDTYVCTLGQPPDEDCDRIPDAWDEFPEDKPFETSHNTIFADLAPGQSVTQSVDIKFKLSTADIYFYLDMTGSMDQERDALITSLTNNNYLPADVAGNDCSDRDFDGTPDNGLKTQGVVGNLACLIRDAQFGAGWFRDLPIGGFYGPDDYEMFEHRLDITNDVPALNAQLSNFKTRGGVDAPEGSMEGLWAIATGGELNAGWNRPGIPARTNCPSGTWGYPCFRDGTLPIIIHITDEGLHAGPSVVNSVGATVWPNPFDDTKLVGKLSSGTPDASGNYYRALTTTAESFVDPQDYGVIDGKLLTYVGSTETMNSDVSYQTIGACTSGSAWGPTTQSAGDAVFKFTVGSKKPDGTNRTVMLSSSGSRFNSSIALVSTAPMVTTLTASNNGKFANPLDLGTLTPGRRVLASGTTVGNPVVHARVGQTLSSTTTCFGNATAADVLGGSVHKFQLANDNVNVRFTGIGGAGNVSVFAGASMEPTVTDLTTINCGSGVSSNCNNKLEQFSVGDVKGKYLHLIKGNSATAALTADYTPYFAGCSGTYGTSRDQTFDFTVSSPTTVRIETSGSGTTLGAQYPHGLALISKRFTPIYTTTSVPNGNGTLATAYTIPASSITSTTGDWLRFEGNSATDTATFSQSEVGGATAGVCGNGNAGAADALRDTVFRLDVTATRAYEFETVPTNPAAGYKTWLSLHKGSIGNAATVPIVAADSTQAVGAYDYNQITLTNGQIEARDRTTLVSAMGTSCGVTTGSTTSGGRDMAFSFTATASGNVTLSTVGASGVKGTDPGFDSLISVFRGTTLLTGTCTNPSGNAYSKTVAVVAGNTYTVVVKEWQYDTTPTVGEGQFGLIIEDARFASSFLGCDAGSAMGNTNFSRITQTLTAGTYYLVVKGTGAASANTYALNVRLAPTTGINYSVDTCSSSSNNRAVIEKLLPVGSYSVILKGQKVGTANRQPTYDLTIRDLSSAPNPVACHNTFSEASVIATGLKKLDASNNPIDYYVVTRPNTAAGSYQLLVEELSTSTPGAGAVCADTGSPYGDDGQLSVDLAPGTYYAVLKGAANTDRGMFQMTIGDAAPTVGNFQYKNWKDHIKAAVTGKSIKVISVDSVGNGLTGGGTALATDSYRQTVALAKETGAPTVSDTQTYEISGTGVGMGAQIISAVNDLTKKLTMDLGVRLVPIAPNVPNPLFGFSAQAISKPTGNCTGGISADGTKHLTCGPGAQPQFSISITNRPAPNNVPLSTMDSSGGYLMKLELVGTAVVNGVTETYQVDSIPVYIIPQDVIADPGTDETFSSTGTYEQVFSAACTGTDRPIWSSLYWDAKIPAGTSLQWNVCSAETTNLLPGCTLVNAGKVTSGAACTSDPTCVDGYCSSANVCEYVAGPSCTGSTAGECGTGGKCVADGAGKTCRWTQNPIDLVPSLNKGVQGGRHLRVSLVMNATSDTLKAPTVNDFHVEYRCSPGI